MSGLAGGAAPGSATSDASTGDAVFALLRGGQGGKLLGEVELGEPGAVVEAACSEPVSELQGCGFRLQAPEPGVEYSIRIGDLRPLGSGQRSGNADYSVGLPFGDAILWPDDAYFESARGKVRARLLSRPVDDPTWTERAVLGVVVVPTKLGEARYQVMFESMRRLAEGLVFDVVSKSVRSVALDLAHGGVTSRSGQLELHVLEALWERLEPELQAIGRQPERHLHRRRAPMRCWGTERLGPAAARQLAHLGLTPRLAASRLPVGLVTERLFESTDTPEHRVIVWFLQLLMARVAECRDDTLRNVSAIERDREFLDHAAGEGPTLYQQIHQPRIDALRAAERRAVQLEVGMRRATTSMPLAGVRPAARPVASPIFENVVAYRRIWQLLVGYLESAAFVVGQDATERVKDTWRLYEQWVFLQLAAAFRSAGARCGAVDGLLRRTSVRRFTLDLGRDARFEFRAADGRLLRLRYEPWIVAAREARRRGDTVYRAAGGRAWSPDVLIEVLLPAAEGRAPDVEYAAVVDAKYSSRIGDRHWDGVEKYLQIRSVEGNRPVTRQVWLAHPGEDESIGMRDAAVSWGPQGPDRPPDEHVFGTLGLRPPAELADDVGGVSPTEVAQEFARGFLAYHGLTLAPIRDLATRDAA